MPHHHLGKTHSLYKDVRFPLNNLHSLNAQKAVGVGDHRTESTDFGLRQAMVS